MRIKRLRFASMLVEAMRAGSPTPALAILLTVGHAAVLGAEPILVSDGRYVQAFAAIELPDGPSDSTDLRRPGVTFGGFAATAVATRTSGGSAARSTVFQRSLVSPSHMMAVVGAESLAEGKRRLGRHRVQLGLLDHIRSRDPARVPVPR